MVRLWKSSLNLRAYYRLTFCISSGSPVMLPYLSTNSSKGGLETFRDRANSMSRFIASRSNSVSVAFCSLVASDRLSLSTCRCFAARKSVSSIDASWCPCCSRVARMCSRSAKIIELKTNASSEQMATVDCLRAFQPPAMMVGTLIVSSPSGSVCWWKDDNRPVRWNRLLRHGRAARQLCETVFQVD